MVCKLGKGIKYLLVNLVLDEPNSQPRDDVQIDGIELVRLQVIVKSVCLVIIFAEDLAQTGSVSMIVRLYVRFVRIKQVCMS